MTFLNKNLIKQWLDSRLNFISEILLKYLKSIRLPIKRPSKPSFLRKFVFILPPLNSSNWILDKITREISSKFSQKETLLLRHGDPIPENATIFFSHYNFYIEALLNDKTFLLNRNAYVWFTHFENLKHRLTNRIIKNCLQTCEKIVCQNSQSIKDLQNIGLPSEKLLLSIGGADPKLFFRKNKIRNNSSINVGLVSAFYNRKNPQLIDYLIKNNSDMSFFLIGKGWELYATQHGWYGLTNFKYFDVEYSEYPDLYSNFDVFFSGSSLEGGPIPLIEALMSGIPSVVSDTGFSRDLIVNGVNGYIFDLKDDPVKIRSLIQSASKLNFDDCGFSEEYSWNSFSEKMSKIIRGKALI